MKWVCHVLFWFLCMLECIAISPDEIEDLSNYLNSSTFLDEEEDSYQPEGGYEEDEPIPDYAWESSGKFEGDIILNELQRRTILSDVVEGLARNAIINTTNRWPNNEVIYKIKKKHFSTEQIKVIQDAIDTIVNVSCVKFRHHRNGENGVVVIKGREPKCFSEVGYQGRRQIINLNPHHLPGKGCFRKGSVLHEFLHTLGFFHMHSSSDRDQYVDIFWNNINKTNKHDFHKYSSYKASDFGVGYDYKSVMHYSRKAQSINGEDTIVPKVMLQNGSYIGQRDGLSQKDILKLNIMYCGASSCLTTEH